MHKVLEHYVMHSILLRVILLDMHLYAVFIHLFQVNVNLTQSLYRVGFLTLLTNLTK